MKIGLIDVDGHHYPNLAIRTGRKTGPRPSQGWRRLWLNNGEVSVMDDIKLAMLGSKEAAKRLTDAGVLVPCWHCGGTDIIIRKVDGLFGKSAYQRTYKYVQCRTCFSQTGYHGTEPKARLAWNTRAPILSAEELEMLEGMENG